ncbi:hypothetical protein P7C70_g5703, partial [Phenoliferia sp. Uapishka_3]
MDAPHHTLAALRGTPSAAARAFLSPPPYYTPAFLAKELSCIRNWTALNRAARGFDPRPEDAINSSIPNTTLSNDIQAAASDLALALALRDSRTVRQLGAFVLAASELLAARFDLEAKVAAVAAAQREEHYRSRRELHRAARQDAHRGPAEARELELEVSGSVEDEVEA